MYFWNNFLPINSNKYSECKANVFFTRLLSTQTIFRKTLSGMRYYFYKNIHYNKTRTILTIFTQNLKKHVFEFQ